MVIHYSSKSIIDPSLIVIELLIQVDLRLV